MLGTLALRDVHVHFWRLMCMGALCACVRDVHTRLSTLDVRRAHSVRLMCATFCALDIHAQHFVYLMCTRTSCDLCAHALRALDAYEHSFAT